MLKSIDERGASNQMTLYTRPEIDQKAIRLASEVQSKESELIETLQLVERLKIYEDYDLKSLYAYCTKRLRLSQDRACTYIRIAQLATKVPAPKEAIKKDEISITAAKKLTQVLKVENQVEWIEKAKNVSTRDLEIAIAKEKPQTLVRESVKPIAESLFELRCALSPKAEELLKRALDLLSSQKQRDVKPGEAIETILEAFVERNDPVKKAGRALNRKTPKLSVARPAIKDGKRTAIPRPVGHIVSLQTGAQCTHVGSDGMRCTERRWLARHHKQEVSLGGLHTSTNLTTLCSFHHRMLHRKQSFVSSDNWTWRW